MAKKTERFYRVNDKIRFSPVMVVDQDGKNLGSIPLDQAKQKARAVKLDLVEVAPQARPPVCRIMDFGKFRYEQGVKQKKQKGKTKTLELKEIRLSPRIADHDIETKAKAAERFVKAGHKVQLKLEYKRRENAHKDLGFEVMEKILNHLDELVDVQRAPKLDGRFLTCLVEPKK
jgi:translation initiation factor IF-3